jgi:hypothetical protein
VHTLLLLVLARGPAPLEAADPTAALDLSWQAPVGCPDALAVRERVATLLASVDARGAPRVLRVGGTITPRASDGVRLRLEITQGESVDARELVGADCREVTEAAALIVAMTLEPSVLDTLEPSELEPSEPEPATLPEPEPAAEATSREPAPAPTEPVDVGPPARPPSTASEPARAMPIGVGAEVEGGVGFGPLPAVSGVLAAAVGVRGRWFRVDATGAYWTPRRSEAREPGVRAQAWSLGARACGVPGAGRVEVPLCAGVVAGLMHARGLGRDLDAERVSSPWAAVIASATAVVRVLPWLGVRVGAEGHVAFARPAFHTDPSRTQVHRAGLGGVALRAGLEVKFGVP